MICQRVATKRVFICCFGLHIISSFLVGFSAAQDLDSNIKAAQSSESGSTSSDTTSETVKPSLIRNIRSNLFPENGPFYRSDADLNSAFLYNDQIMQNLLSSPPSKPLSYARSNFFLNYLKPRTTRYNPWDDHSLMHFGKRSLESDIENEKVLVKRSTEIWSPNNVLHFGKKSENAVKNDEWQQKPFDTETGDFELDDSVHSKDPDISNSNSENDYPQNDNTKKSADAWHSMMSFGKKSQNPWDHNTMHFGKRDEPWHSMMSFGKRGEPWHSMMSFGKRDDPWNNMMSFGKKDEPWHNMMSFGKRDEPWHNMMSFGKRNEPWHSMMSFGKREEPWHSMMSFGKRDEPWHNMMSFGKREEPWHNMMSFGKREEPWHNMMSFGKRFENVWDHNTLHFGKRDSWDHNTLHFGKRDPWDHNTLHFGKRDPWDHNTLHFGKRDPWDHNTLHFGKRDPWDHDTLHFGKRDDPWHNMMSFGKRSDNPWDHNTLHFGKKDEPWHNMMSFGKKSELSDMTDLEKRDDPWHNMMSFGKKSDGLLNNSFTTVDKRDEPWHNMMSFGKKSEFGFDHDTLHFGKKDEPWHNMMSFGKKSENPWDHSTLHFGKKNEPWHNTMSFGKKLDPLAEKYNFLFKNTHQRIRNTEKKADGLMDDLSEDFSRDSDPWHEYDGMMFYKKSDPWDHNTLHFGKKSNVTWELEAPTEKINPNHIKKRSIDMLNNPNTMHFDETLYPWDSQNKMHLEEISDSLENNNENNFENKEYGDMNKLENIDKKFDWDSHNTMHFGKRVPEDYRNAFLFDKKDPWESHNTMHFGKRDPWEHHNTMHFGKRDPWEHHNTMHFGKRDSWGNYNTMHFGRRDPWHYHDTMHFGKRDPWNYHNTMHFGKRSDPDSKEASIFNQDKSINENEVKAINMDNTEDKTVSKTDKKQSDIIKRSPFDPKSENNDIMNDKPGKITDKLKFLHESKPKKQSLKNSEHTDSIKSKENLKLGMNKNLVVKDYANTPQVSGEKSRIQKRSVNLNSLIRNFNEDFNKNRDLVGKDSNDEVADSVLHFGKRSVEDTDENENHWINGESEKRFDDFWNDHSTLHFGKKSEPWDNYNTLHFGKKSDPQDAYSALRATKTDPWEHLSMLHFGKKFDPWEGHGNMHFGKRTDNWDHNVMHFGKRKEFTPEEYEVLSTLDIDPIELNNYLQSLNAEENQSEENKDFLDNLVILKSIINSRLKDDNIPLKERINLLRHYLKPVLKAIIDAEGSKFIPYMEPNRIVNDRINDYNNNAEDITGESRIIPFQAKDGIKYDQVIFNKGNDDSSYGEYGDNVKMANLYSKESENLRKSKRKHLAKPELKRYFTPFQGPKSIVYPHAWFASQIRRSSLPRTKEYARRMEMRMAEKKEDPFNSYMHFGRR